MLKIFSIIMSVISFIFKLLKPKEDISIQEQLARAIKEGNTKEVERIREYIRRLKQWNI